MTSFNLCPCFCNFLYYKLSSCCKISKMTALKYIYDDACNRVYLFLLPFFISKYFSCCKLTELQYLIKYFFIYSRCLLSKKRNAFQSPEKKWNGRVWEARMAARSGPSLSDGRRWRSGRPPRPSMPAPGRSGPAWYWRSTLGTSCVMRWCSRQQLHTGPLPWGGSVTL